MKTAAAGTASWPSLLGPRGKYRPTCQLASSAYSLGNGVNEASRELCFETREPKVVIMVVKMTKFRQSE